MKRRIIFLLIVLTGLKMYGKTYYSFYSWYIDKEYTHNYYYGLYNFFKNINNWSINNICI